MDDARYDAIINIVYNNDKAIEALEDMADKARLSYKEIEKASKQLERVQRDELDAYDNLIKERVRIDDAYEKHMRDIGKGQIQEQRDELEAYEQVNRERAALDKKREQEYVAHLKHLNKEHAASGKILLDIDKANADALSTLQKNATKQADANIRSQRTLRTAALQVQNKEDADAESQISNVVGKQLRDRANQRKAAQENEKATRDHERGAQARERRRGRNRDRKSVV